MRNFHKPCPYSNIHSDESCRTMTLSPFHLTAVALSPSCAVLRAWGVRQVQTILFILTRWSNMLGSSLAGDGVGMLLWERWDIIHLYWRMHRHYKRYDGETTLDFWNEIMAFLLLIKTHLKRLKQYSSLGVSLTRELNRGLHTYTLFISTLFVHFLHRLSFLNYLEQTVSYCQVFHQLPTFLYMWKSEI